MSQAVRPRAGPVLLPSQVLQTFCLVVVVLACLQLVLFRILSRAAIFIPRGGVGEEVLAFLSRLGLAALQAYAWMAPLLLLAVLALHLYLGWGRWPLLAGGYLAGGLILLVAGLLPLGSVPLYNLLAWLYTLSFCAGLAAVVRTRGLAGGLVLLALVYTFSYGFNLLQGWGGIVPGVAPLAPVLAAAGQMLALALPLYLAILGCRRGSVVPSAGLLGLAAGAGVVYLVAYAWNSSLVAILANWGPGFNLNLPAVIYALALAGAVVAAGVWLRLPGQEAWRGWGLVLVFLGGFSLATMADVAVSLAGLGLWGLPSPLTGPDR